jgi:hypothetical protein
LLDPRPKTLQRTPSNSRTLQGVLRSKADIYACYRRAFRGCGTPQERPGLSNTSEVAGLAWSGKAAHELAKPQECGIDARHEAAAQYPMRANGLSDRSRLTQHGDSYITIALTLARTPRGLSAKQWFLRTFESGQFRACAGLRLDRPDWFCPVHDGGCLRTPLGLCAYSILGLPA